MYRDAEDVSDVGHHCLKLLGVLLEAHFCQHQGFTNILEGNKKKTSILINKISLFTHYTNSCRFALSEKNRNAVCCRYRERILAPSGGFVYNCNFSIFTFLSRHLDWGSIAKCSLSFTCCVHFIFDAAVDNPKLYLRPSSSAENSTD